MNKNGQDKIRDIIELSEVIGPTDALEPSAKPKSGRRAQAELLVEVAADVELFCGPDKTAYVDVHVNGHRETWPLDGSDFEQWLAHRFYQQTQTVPNSDAWRSALKILQAKARFEAPVRNVHVRVAGLGDRIYLDLADADWQVVEISPDSWRVIKNPPVRFRRPAGMLALPVPETGGSIEALRQFLNVERDGDFVISTAWLVAAFHPQGPYPVMVVTGEQGAAKSAFCNVLRRIVDPHEEPLPSVPRNEEDLFVAAQHAHVLGFDNVSVLKPEMSDACCRLASGGAYIARKLYTNREQSVLRAQRPLILNSIEQVVMREDLISRSLQVNLPLIEGRRLTERQFWPKFYDALPSILGGIMDAISCGLRNLPLTTLSEYPRMADFAHFIVACEPALWPQGTFEAAYRRNREEAIQLGIEADPVASAVLEFAMQTMQTMQTENLGQSPDSVTVFEGTATELLIKLSECTDVSTRRSRYWPKMASTLSRRLYRAAPGLRVRGVNVDRDRVNRESTRMIYLNVHTRKFKQSSCTWSTERCGEAEVEVELESAVRSPKLPIEDSSKVVASGPSALSAPEGDTKAAHPIQGRRFIKKPLRRVR